MAEDAFVLWPEVGVASIDAQILQNELEVAPELLEAMMAPRASGTRTAFGVALRNEAASRLRLQRRHARCSVGKANIPGDLAISNLPIVSNGRVKDLAGLPRGCLIAAEGHHGIAGRDIVGDGDFGVGEIGSEGLKEAGCFLDAMANATEREGGRAFRFPDNIVGHAGEDGGQVGPAIRSIELLNNFSRV